MEQGHYPLSGKELAEWDAGRDLLAEINAGVDQMLEGTEVPTRVVEVSETVDALRKNGFS